MQVRYHTLDVFTEHRFGGNPLAVFPDARDVPEAAMASIARELNLSETVFVLPPRIPQALRRARIFTPARELPFAGHPTLGTACLLDRLGLTESAASPSANGVRQIVLDEDAGPVAVMLRRNAGAPTFAQLLAPQAPTEGPPPPGLPQLASALGLEPDELLSGADAPRAFSAGIPFLFVGVRDRRALARVRPLLDRWRAVLGDYWTAEVMLVCREVERQGSTLRARMFAPLLGVLEDPATGSAAAALPGYLLAREPRADGVHQWVVEQGFEMGRPSLLQIEADVRGGRPVAVRVGGHSVHVAEATMTLDTL